MNRQVLPALLVIFGLTSWANAGLAASIQYTARPPMIASATDFDTAMLRCRNRSAYVASYEDLYYVIKNNPFLRIDHNPNGNWIGPDLVGNNEALIGNRNVISAFSPEVEDLEGIGSKFDVRSYWCAHDVE